MKLTLTRNLGRGDAKRIGIEDLEDAQRGKLVTIKDKKVLDEFRQRGLVVETTADGTVVVEGAKEEKPDFDGMTIAQLREFADAHKIEGVKTTMSHDETAKHVKREFNKVR